MRMNLKRAPIALLSGALLAAMAAGASAQTVRGFEHVMPSTPASNDPSQGGMQRMIVKVNALSSDKKGSMVDSKLAQWSAATGTQWTFVRQLSMGAWLISAPQTLGRASMESLALNLKSIDTSIEYIHPDYPIKPYAVPNDPLYPAQWHYQPPGTNANPGGANLPGAWDITRGNGVTVAVLDTGYLPHIDLNSNIAPGGYDFVSFDDFDATPGRDIDPTDSFGISTFGPCNPGCSWHGTHVAGTIAARGNNAMGVAGVAYESKVLPVRVLTSASGSLSDVMDGLAWTIGMDVPGLPGQAQPRAQVINMSLGSLEPFACPGGLANIVNVATSRNVVIVAAAGNANQPANYPPANCPGVINVAAMNREGNRSSFSNFGPNITVSAPGGESQLSVNSILSTYNLGGTSAGTDNYEYLAGTSMAAPHVAGVAALIKSVRPSATVAEVTQILRQSARPFPANSTCNTANCGPGMLDATAAINLTAGGSNKPFDPTLGGTWYDPAKAGQGFLIDIDAARQYVFLGWYAFAHNAAGGATAAERQRWFSIQSSYTPGERIKTMPVYLNTGGNFDQPPVTQASQIGTATLSFQSCTSATLSYQISFDGQSKAGTIPLTRLTANQYCDSGVMPQLSLTTNGINPTLDGAWYQPSTAGQGFQFVFSPLDNRFAFLSWYTYDLNGQNSGTSGQRWYTIQGNYSANSREFRNLPIYETAGGQFGVSPPAPTTTPIGQADLIFHSCNSASLTYRIPGRASRTIPLTRLLGGEKCRP